MKAVLINIFGGILRCDVLATGVVNAARELNVKVPIVVRMEGTNVEKGQEILKDSGFNFTVAERHEGRRGESSEAGAMSVLVDRKHARIFQGFTGREGTFHAQAVHRLRDESGWRRYAGQGRTDASGSCRYSTPSRKR